MNHLLTFFFSIILTSAFSQEAKVSGMIHHAKLPTFLALEKMVMKDGNMNVVKYDSCQLNADGSFNLKIQLKEPTALFLFDGSDALNLVLMPGDHVTLELDKRYFDETVVIKGVGAERNTAIHQLDVIRESIHSNLVREMYYPDTLKVLEDYDQAFDTYSKIVRSYRERYPELKDYLDESLAKLQEEKTMHKIALRSDYELNMKVVGLMNKYAPELSGIGLKGEPVKLSDFKGKITVIDFWANWCLPCRAEFPELERMESMYGKEVNFVSIGVFCSEKLWKEVAKDLKVPNQFFVSELMQKQLIPYGVAYIPRYIVLDAEHQVISALAPLPSSGILQKYWEK